MPDSSEGKLRARTRDADAVIARQGVVYDLREPAGQTVMALGELRVMTDWDDDTLFERIGCNPARWVELGGAPAEDPGAPTHSQLFLELVVDLVKLVDLVKDRRRVVNVAYELSAEAGGVVAERVPRIRAALDVADPEDVTALELLGLGEIGRARRQASMHMDSGPGYEAAQATARLTDGIDDLGAHLGVERLKALAREDADDLLGSNVRERMVEHLVGDGRGSGCAPCRTLQQRVIPTLSPWLESLRHQSPPAVA